MLEVNTHTATTGDIEEFLNSAVLCFSDEQSKKVQCKINSEDWTIESRKSPITDELRFVFTKGTVESVEQAIADFNGLSVDAYTEEKNGGYDAFFTHIRVNGSTVRGLPALLSFGDAVSALSLYQ